MDCYDIVCHSLRPDQCHRGNDYTTVFSPRWNLFEWMTFFANNWEVVCSLLWMRSAPGLPTQVAWMTGKELRLHADYRSTNRTQWTSSTFGRKKKRKILPSIQAVDQKYFHLNIIPPSVRFSIYPIAPFLATYLCVITLSIVWVKFEDNYRAMFWARHPHWLTIRMVRGQAIPEFGPNPMARQFSSSSPADSSYSFHNAHLMIIIIIIRSSPPSP